MSWARKKKSPATPNRPRRRDAADTAPGRRHWRKLALPVGWAVLIVGVVAGLHRLEPYALSVLKPQPTQWELRWVDLKSWVPDFVVQETQQRLVRAGLFDRSLHDSELAADIGTNLAASPWIESVHRVSKQADGVLRVHAEFRQWLTMVTYNGMAYLVDREGVRLPRQERSAFLNPSDWIVVEGAAGPVPEVGERWASPGLAAGLDLVHYLHQNAPSALRASMRAVDISNYERAVDPLAGVLRIRTLHADGFIEWGLPPGEEHDIEPAADRKLAALNTLYKQRGQLPPGQIELRYEDRILVGEPR